MSEPRIFQAWQIMDAIQTQGMVAELLFVHKFEYDAVVKERDSYKEQCERLAAAIKKALRPIHYLVESGDADIDGLVKALSANQAAMDEIGRGEK